MVFNLHWTCDPMMYTHPFVLLNYWTCEMIAPFVLLKCVFPMPLWLHTGSLEPRVPHSSIQVLTENVLNTCFLPPHKRDLQSQWGAPLWNPDLWAREPAVELVFLRSNFPLSPLSCLSPNQLTLTQSSLIQSARRCLTFRPSRYWVVEWLSPAVFPLGYWSHELNGSTPD